MPVLAGGSGTVGADTATPLCTWGQLTQGAFSDLTRNITSAQAQNDILLEATRLCEQACGRRLAPFTGVVETHRLGGIDPDEYTDAGGPYAFSTGQVAATGYQRAVGGDAQVRHMWVNEYAARYPELWAYSGVSVSIGATVGGTKTLPTTGVTGPEPDSGHVWLTIGTYAPTGSLARITYGGGYQTTPADLVRACKFMAASLIVRELAPSAQSRDPRMLVEDAVGFLSGYMRDS